MTQVLTKNEDNQVICKFCNNACEFSLDEVYKCFTCHVWYDPSKNTILFLVSQNDRMYKICILLEEDKSHIYKYYDHGYYLITSFDYLLNITPDNLQNKLKTYLLFL